ncbi:MAG: Ig-like domain-containing protein [candidate division Zixibacteria bacterium]|nr:Ig-like domain-containing protein [candidate division Zixibacteria bacterium]
MKAKLLSRLWEVSLSLSILLFLVIGCAEVAVPPGGEVDRQAPRVIKTYPVTGSTGVVPSNEITFWFSEGITPPRTEKAVFITPRPKSEPKLKWKTDRLTIELPEPFEPNQTYVVTLAASISDWRNNRMDSSVILAFSTGETIDSGSVGGVVFHNENPRRGLLVGLYENIDSGSSINYDSIYPSYLTSTAKDGAFQFRYLPDRHFQLVAFEDINRNDRFNPEREPYAVSDRKIDFGTGQPLDKLFLELTEIISDSVVIISASKTSDGLIKVRLNKALQTSAVDAVSLTSTVDSTVFVSGSFLESSLELSAVYTFSIRDVDTGNYDLKFIYNNQSDFVTYKGLHISATDDKSAPFLFSFEPEDKVHFLKDLSVSFTFSEPIDRSKLTSQTFVLLDSEDSLTSLNYEWINDFALKLIPEDSLSEGESYRVLIAEFELSDLAGNLLGDSITEKKFRLIDRDSLGSVSGSVVSNLTKIDSGSLRISFKSLKSTQSYHLRLLNKTFKIDLPAGKYLLSGYIDEDDSGGRGKGSALPYTLAETYFKYDDTISVRARFETAGIELEVK